MPLGLTIFEERYKQMIGHCLESSQPFGVALIRHGVEAGGPLAQPYPIGCLADIVQLEPAEEGAFHLLAVGRERFRLTGLSLERPYLVGTADPFPLESDADPHQEDRLLRPFVERYLEILADAGDVRLDLGQLPGEPLPLAYLAAHLVLAPPAQKQPLLAAPAASYFFTNLRSLYRREIVLLEEMLSHTDQQDQGMFSLS
jgi:Lon protease-like protein